MASETPTRPRDIVVELREYAEMLRLPEWVIDPVKSAGPDLLLAAVAEIERLRGRGGDVPNRPTPAQEGHARHPEDETLPTEGDEFTITLTVKVRDVMTGLRPDPSVWLTAAPFATGEGCIVMPLSALRAAAGGAVAVPEDRPQRVMLGQGQDASTIRFPDAEVER